MTFAQQTFLFIYLIKKMTLGELNYMRGTPTMAPRNMCKQARVIDTNQIQSKTQEVDKILNHRDLKI